MDSDPSFKLWETIKTNLTTPDGQNFFNNTVKDAEIPGTAVPGVTNFTGTVISVDPPDKPTTITLGVEDPKTPDATWVFSSPSIRWNRLSPAINWHFPAWQIAIIPHRSC